MSVVRHTCLKQKCNEGRHMFVGGISASPHPLLTLRLPSFFCDIGYQGVGGYHPPLNFVIILF